MLATVTSPPNRRQNARVMARPSPVPPKRRVVETSAWVNRSNSLSSCSGVMPMPVSATLSTTSPPARSARPTPSAPNEHPPPTEN